MGLLALGALLLLAAAPAPRQVGTGAYEAILGVAADEGSVAVLGRARCGGARGESAPLSVIDTAGGGSALIAEDALTSESRFTPAGVAVVSTAPCPAQGPQAPRGALLVADGRGRRELGRDVEWAALLGDAVVWHEHGATRANLQALRLQATGAPAAATFDPRAPEPQGTPFADPAGTTVGFRGCRVGAADDALFRDCGELLALDTLTREVSRVEAPARFPLLPDSAATPLAGQFSPDGQQLLSCSARGLVVSSASGTNRRRLPAASCSEGSSAFSPDSRWIAWVRITAAQCTAVLESLDGRVARELGPISGGCDERWPASVGFEGPLVLARGGQGPDAAGTVAAARWRDPLARLEVLGGPACDLRLDPSGRWAALLLESPNAAAQCDGREYGRVELTPLTGGARLTLAAGQRPSSIAFAPGPPAHLLVRQRDGHHIHRADTGEDVPLPGANQRDGRWVGPAVLYELADAEAPDSGVTLVRFDLVTGKARPLASHVKAWALAAQHPRRLFFLRADAAGLWTVPLPG